MSSENVLLIGFMGVGKGRTARELSRLTGRFALDTDNMIESVTKQKIRDIFDQQGEAAFRRMEQRTADWLRHHVTNTIVSTGGGFFMVKDIGKIGNIIYLHSSLEAIIEAIKRHPKAERKIAKRPLLQDLDAARKLYYHRLPKYRNAAEHEINVEGKEIKEVAAEIAKLF